MKLAEAKATLSELVARVRGQHERVTITVHGEPAAVLMAVEDLASMEETIEILSDPETVGRLIASDAELARGEIVTADELAEAMAVRRAMSHRSA
ncbi:type II toxin-antitoxin system Phd/YefM family antitoxin [Nocardia caishijiensis]|uniref:Antitoxin n=1 Tax=Nocardia caishijiensis TaxID=184756 RepID=A0ABQ6YU81_9NOCA|nr:type II toxin-antitoxin system Phd/YefM family antitoxin [Nocardia caishijiensis]KAF0849358.1 prevent-host-death family protein [Nocardia caishijiensis]